MRHLIDTYIRAEESEKVSAFDDMSLVQLIVERGADAVEALPEGHSRRTRRPWPRPSRTTSASSSSTSSRSTRSTTRRCPKLLDALIEQRRQEALDYQKYLEQIVELTKKVKNPEAGARIPSHSTPRPSARCTTTSARTRSWRWRWIAPSDQADRTIGAVIHSR